MEKIIVEGFIEKIPNIKKVDILKKIDKFTNELEKSNFDFSKISKGYYPRQIVGNTRSKIYKFRVNEKDRVLFTYGKYIKNIRREFSNSIIFIDYFNHDKQIINGKNLTINDESLIDMKVDEEVVDLIIEHDFENFVYDPNKIISQIVTSEDLSTMFNDDNSKALFYLSDKQAEIVLKETTPLFLFGIAGSGKTTIGINKAFLLCEGNIQIAYFTHSDKLVKDSKRLFSELCKYKRKHYDGNMTFTSVNNYLLKISQKNAYVNFREFEQWYNSNLKKIQKFSKVKINAGDVWREIRGIIKGLFYVNWTKILINKSIINEDTVQFLQKKQLATLNNDSLVLNIEKIATINDEVNKYNHKDIELVKEDIARIFTIIDKKIFSKNMMDEDIYLNLPSKYSVISKEDRKLVYDIAKRYQKWLEQNNGKVDENDIARIGLREYYSGNVDMFDFIICDEVQDLTEIQIYFLFKVVADKSKILFSGDYNQTINPTFFNTKRIESLYKLNNGLKRFNLENVTTNYRSTKDIVETSNKLIELRKKFIGDDNNHDYFEVPIRPYKDKLFMLDNTPHNRKELFKSGLTRHYVGIVVANENEKEKLEKEIGIKDIIFTVNEIKGIEKDYIICVNIISSYKSKWNEILDKNLSNKDEYRLYFNILYVALTRARSNICFIEEENDIPIISYLESNIVNIDYFDEDSLKLNRRSDLDEFYKEGLKLEAQGLFEKAISLYKRANLNKNKTTKAIKRCEALIDDSAGKYNEAGEKLMKIREYELASHSFIRCNNFLKLLIALVYNNEKYENIHIQLKRFGKNPLIIRNSCENEEWVSKFDYIFERYKKEQICNLNEEIKNINRSVSEIEKKVQASLKIFLNK